MHIAGETESFIKHFFTSFQLIVKIISLATYFLGVIISMAPLSLKFWYLGVFPLKKTALLTTNTSLTER